MKKFLPFVYSVVIGGSIGFLIATLIISALEMPDVLISYSTGECVKVMNYVETDRFSCENMPTKFNHVWVK